VPEETFEANAVAIVIWNMVRKKPEGFHAFEAINKYPTETTRRRPPSGRSASRWGKRDGAELHAIVGEV
jgi:hypothetical protein